MSLDTEAYVYKLRFSIDKDSPPDYMKRWLDFKNKCAGGGGENRHIVEHIKESCSLQENKRVYFGPVNLVRMRVTLIDDMGNIVNLNGADWNITLISEILYQY